MRIATLCLLAACHGDDPIDVDGDGFDDAEDCDDHDAAVHPDAIEIWYDDIDQNCDRADDLPLTFERIPRSLDGEHPAGPRIGRDDDVARVDLVFTNDGENTTSRVSAAYDSGTGHPISDHETVLEPGEGGLAFALGRTLDSAMVPGTEGVIAASIVTGNNDLRASVVRFDEDGGWQWGGHGPSGVTDHYLDMAIDVDDDILSIVGCGADEITWLSGTLASFEDLTFSWANVDAAGVGCEVVGPEVRVLDEDGVVTAYTVDGNALVPGRTWSDVVDLAWVPDGFLTVTGDHVVLTRHGNDTELPTSEVPVRARLDISPDDQLFVVYATDGGDLYLLYGPLDGPYTESLVGSGIAKAELDVEASRKMLFIGARTLDDCWIAVGERGDP